MISSRLTRRSVIYIGIFCCALLVPLYAQLTQDAYLLSMASRMLIYALAALSLDLLIGYGGLVSFGHAAYVGIGAYTVGILSFHSMEGSPIGFLPGHWEGSESALVSLPLAMLSAGLGALVFGALSLRTRGIHFIMITLAFAQMLYYLCISLYRYGGEDGLLLAGRNQLPGLDLYNDLHFYGLCLACLLLYGWLIRRLLNARFGQVIRAGKQNEQKLQALGFASYRYQLLAFVIAGMGAGLAGGLLANQTEFVSPDLLSWHLSGVLMVMVILGGLGTLLGPVMGAVAYLLMEEVLAGYTEHWQLILGPLLLLVVLFSRKGIFGLLAGKEAEDG
ncbi:branched-chain amino acid ABC transporter permease [Aestuariirhabdus litorea]|uniref:Branched-chain amino acid ABC transporter permease n=1 Tax=Aestuariirhabdus litorea TaxID=2528527 RepID=A0A3P3VV57_9GAMM|nr:branched-chain amino acid ABC transporter permease [Aestuariirhabdus litorea]RRJ85319.1 branched-chain amino acid ABC transporter permease [Aestuariirhabdus litorea]RWW98541.1 branched-chain amino acid ABC transporter permease [Endozoicomonadaceae bacterium GTF-13]